MKNYKAWRFLVSRNQYLDYRTVVAPDFICKSSVSSILAREANGDITEKYSLSYHEIRNPEVGDLTLAFRVIEATAQDTGIPGNGVLKDSFGREIYLIEGIVFREIIHDYDLVTWQKLEEIHKVLVNDYREFWEDTVYSQARPSESFDFPDVNDSQQLHKKPESSIEKSDSREGIDMDNIQINGETQISHQYSHNFIKSILQILGCPIFILLKKLSGK